jgi:hypothetical protein
VREISLGWTNLVAVVDDADYEPCLALGPWYPMRNRRGPGGTIYARNAQDALMHRFIIRAPRNLVVDHRDGDGLNNLRDNLRVCSARQNRANSRPTRSNLSGYKGVRYYRTSNKWGAGLVVNGQRIWLGMHDKPEAAALAYDTAARKAHGEYAWLNFGDGLAAVSRATTLCKTGLLEMISHCRPVMQPR